MVFISRVVSVFMLQWPILFNHFIIPATSYNQDTVERTIHICYIMNVPYSLYMLYIIVVSILSFIEISLIVNYKTECYFYTSLKDEEGQFKPIEDPPKSDRQVVADFTDAVHVWLNPYNKDLGKVTRVKA